MSTRIDHSDYLIHFTKDTKDSSCWDFQKSYENLLKIVKEGVINTSSYLRLKKIESICFTEASYAALTEDGVLNKKYFKRYSPFGLMFSKKYIYKKGGLPVIYGPKEDFDSIQDNDLFNWRFVSYNPIGNTNEYRDFSWEREWRIKPIGSFTIDPENVKLIFPSLEWAEKFRNDHDAEHQLESCECNCLRECTIVEYDRLLGSESNSTLIGNCDDEIKFPWVLVNMNCK